MSKNTSPSLIRPCLRLAHRQLVPQSGNPICGTLWWSGQQRASNRINPFIFSPMCIWLCFHTRSAHGQHLPAVFLVQGEPCWWTCSPRPDLSCRLSRHDQVARGCKRKHGIRPKKCTKTVCKHDCTRFPEFIICEKNITKTTCQHSVSRLLISSHMCLLCRLMVHSGKTCLYKWLKKKYHGMKTMIHCGVAFWPLLSLPDHPKIVVGEAKALMEGGPTKVGLAVVHGVATALGSHSCGFHATNCWWFVWIRWSVVYELLKDMANALVGPPPDT